MIRPPSLSISGTSLGVRSANRGAGRETENGGPRRPRGRPRAPVRPRLPARADRRALGQHAHSPPPVGPGPRAAHPSRRQTTELPPPLVYSSRRCTLPLRLVRARHSPARRLSLYPIGRQWLAGGAGIQRLSRAPPVRATGGAEARPWHHFRRHWTTRARCAPARTGASWTATSGPNEGKSASETPRRKCLASKRMCTTPAVASWPRHAVNQWVGGFEPEKWLPDEDSNLPSESGVAILSLLASSPPSQHADYDG